MRTDRIITTALLTLIACPAAVRADQRVTLDTGDVFVGEVIEQSDASVIVNHPLLGRVELPRQRVRSVVDASVVAPPAAAPEAIVAADAPPVAVPEKPAAPVAAQPEKKKTWLDEWDIELAVGFSHRNSNTESLNVNASVSAAYTDALDRWRIQAAYFMSEQDGDTNRHDFHAGIQKDWLMPDSPWFVFLQGEYDYDDFKSWTHRASGHGGLGVSLEQWTGLDANLRIGGGVTREFGGVDPNTRPESIVGSELALKLGDRQTIAATANWFPSIDGSGEYRLVTTGSWTLKLTEALGLRLGARNEYDSSEPAGFDKNDLRVFGSLVFKF